MTINTRWTENDDGTATLEQVIEIEIEASFSGHKSSEGDGRTAADIEREMEESHGAQ